MQNILFVEDDPALRLATVQGLELAGLAVRAFAGAQAALAAILPDFDGIVVSDIRMPGMDGLQLLAAAQAIDPDLPVILVTGHGDVPMAVAALKDGAYDFITKPFAVDHLVATVRRALERRGLVMENRRLRAMLDAAEAESPLIGADPAMVALRARIHTLAEADIDVLIEGEAGTGKDLVASLLHRRSARRAKPFVTIDCAALDDVEGRLLLFGHAVDSVAHTRVSRVGQIAVANGGTLLLDGVDALPPSLQISLLRVIEDRDVHPIGAERPDAVNLRVVATSTVDLAAAAASGAFREDLYHRLAVTRIQLPPLRARDHDRIILFAAFARRAAQEFGLPDYVLPDAVRRHLLSYDWPANVRELRNYAYNEVLTASEPIQVRDPNGDLRSRVGMFEESLIRDTLRRTKGNVAKAIDVLQVPRKTLYDKFNRYGIDPSKFRDSPGAQSIMKVKSSRATSRTPAIDPPRSTS